MVKRYNVYLPAYETGDIEEEHDGEYVKHSDYAALAERCERLEGALRKALEWVPEIASASARKLLKERIKVTP
jgi:hypothetical protein